MNWEAKYIKKLMGWCPNAKANEARKLINLENFDSNTPDRARGENENLENPGWLRKTSTYTLLISTFFTLVYILVINHLGLKLAFLLAGFFISVAFIAFDWKKQMHRYDTLAQKLIFDNSGMEKVSQIMKLIFYAMLFYWIFSGDIERNFSLQVTFSFMGGFLAGMWLSYFQLIYWQKKNHKTIYFNKSYGKWKKSYIIRENE
ncbi:DUF1673 domain-containing protein [Methanosarcina sp. Z-7115]|uniref:DUF1673 domain-containing protein n=1 Tax=Methanosarcina baikalica TaxID=3073890 RepID=A0ABU2D2L5_9EURY|nr:DUF1673 domain-containing protein [Methanosarcina sp. Z-7115]MDR7666231.1 DUF1673 domain-containing protein [Methanosarcina sp. Z-7115]